MSMRQLKIVKSVTNREAQSLEKYLQEIGKVQLIDATEEVDLAIQIKAGNQKALDKLVRANLRFVVSVAKQYQNQGLSLPDLINEGNVGLITSARRFDETRGFKFISYAVWWIRQSILLALAEQARLVRMPLNKVSIYTKTHKAFLVFEQEHEREPSSEELAELLGMEEREINNILQSNTRHTSLDAPMHEGGDQTLGDLIESEDGAADDVMHGSLRTEIDRYCRFLSPREDEILRAYYRFDGDSGITIEELGHKYSVTPERMRQIRLKAIKRLQRIESKKKLLKKYLGY